jgi:hypothetical protein
LRDLLKELPEAEAKNLNLTITTTSDSSYKRLKIDDEKHTVSKPKTLQIKAKI